MAQAFVNPTLLTWARERAGFTVAEISKKLSVKPEQVEAWEAGEKKPTFRQAQNFADKTFTPLGFLFLQKPPKEELLLPDLRTVGDHPVGEFSLALQDTILGAVERQEWYREYSREQDLPKLDWVGSVFLNDLKQAVDKVAELLGGGIAQRPSSFEDYFRELISKIEALGALVMRNSIVGSNTHRPLNKDEFRGFTISDERAPIIFINATDSPQAQLFTLLHEFVHLLLNESGVSDLNPRNENKIEKFCNRVAAEFLVPTDEFITHWDVEALEWKANLPELARHFHVSEWVIARRALECGFIGDAQYWEHYGKILSALKKQKESQKEKGGGPTYYRLIKMRFSKKLAESVTSEALSGRMLLRDAQHLIGVHPSKLKTFAKEELSF